MTKKTSGILTRIRNITRANKLIIACAAVAIISVLPRLEMFAPQMRNTEWNSGTVLRHLAIWEEAGPLRYAFNPVVTYPGPADRFIDNHASTQEGFEAYSDRNGTYFYTTYPQFGYIAPYLFFKLLFLSPSIVGLRVFGLLIQVLTAALLCAIVIRMTGKRLPGFIAFASYALSPIAMYYHSFNYMSDMLVPVLFAASAYVFLRIAEDEKNLRQKAWILGALLFLFAYTEYLGFFVAALMAAFLFFHHTGRMRYVMALACLLPVGLALCVSVAQYVSVGNLSDFVSTMTSRYADAYEPFRTTLAIRDLLYWYGAWHGHLYAAAGIFIAMSWLIRCAQGKRDAFFDMTKRKAAIWTLVILAVPVVAHHVLFLSWTAYHAQYFSTLKSLLFFSVLLGLAFWILVYKTPAVTRGPIVLLVALLLTWALHASYQRFAWTMGYDISPYSYCEAGKKMSRVATENEVIFVKDASLTRHNFPISPVFAYCAGRNIAIYTSRTEAGKLIRENGASGGVAFTLSYLDGAGVDIVRIEEVKN